MRRARGFTLVEMLVALFAMAILAGLSWRGLDTMMRTRQQTETRADEVLALQAGLAQWQADLDAIALFSPTPPIEWNGRVLRLTRVGRLSPGEGVHVVGWTRRDGQWRRWASQAISTRGDLDAAWQQADLWAQNQGGDALRAQEVVITPLADWQIFFFRENAWTNPQSSASTTAVGTAPVAATPPATAASDAAPPPAPATPVTSTNPMPDGVRLVLQIPPGRAISGALQRDWMRPTLTP